MTKMRTVGSGASVAPPFFSQRSNQARCRSWKLPSAASGPNSTSPAYDNSMVAEPWDQGPTKTRTGPLPAAVPPMKFSNVARLYESYQPPT